MTGTDVRANQNLLREKSASEIAVMPSLVSIIQYSVPRKAIVTTQIIERFAARFAKIGNQM